MKMNIIPIVVCGLALSGMGNRPALAEESTSGYAVPRKDLYQPLPEAMRRSVVTYPNMTYPLVKRAANGYILYHTQEGPPTLGYIPFRDIHSGISDEYGGRVRARRQVFIDPGYIPLARGEKYEIVGTAGTEYLVRFEFQDICLTTRVSRAEVDVVTVESMQDELATRRKEAEFLRQTQEIEAVLNAARATTSTEAAMAMLKAAIQKYPDHPKIAECSVLLEDLQVKKLRDDMRRRLEQKAGGTTNAPT